MTNNPVCDSFIQCTLKYLYNIQDDEMEDEFQYIMEKINGVP